MSNSNILRNMEEWRTRLSAIQHAGASDTVNVPVEEMMILLHHSIDTTRVLETYVETSEWLQQLASSKYLEEIPNFPKSTAQPRNDVARTWIVRLLRLVGYKYAILSDSRKAYMASIGTENRDHTLVTYCKTAERAQEIVDELGGSTSLDREDVVLIMTLKPDVSALARAEFVEFARKASVNPVYAQTYMMRSLVVSQDPTKPYSVRCVCSKADFDTFFQDNLDHVIESYVNTDLPLLVMSTKYINGLTLNFRIARMSHLDASDLQTVLEHADIPLSISVPKAQVKRVCDWKDR